MPEKSGSFSEKRADKSDGTGARTGLHVQYLEKR